MERSAVSITQAVALGQEVSGTMMLLNFIILQLYAAWSHDSHVTYLYLRALVSANKIDEAETVSIL